jgi:hypothetical protein
MNRTAPSSSAFAQTGWNFGSENASPATLPPIAAPQALYFHGRLELLHRKLGVLQRQRREGREPIRMRRGELRQLLVLDADDLGRQIAISAVPIRVDREHLHVDRLGIHALQAIIDGDVGVLGAANGGRRQLGASSPSSAVASWK